MLKQYNNGFGKVVFKTCLGTDKCKYYTFFDG